MLTPDHIVIVIEENHDKDQIVGNPDAPYLNNTLIKDGLYYQANRTIWNYSPAPTPVSKASTRRCSNIIRRE
jgi:hypothetical protein